MKILILLLILLILLILIFKRYLNSRDHYSNTKEIKIIKVGKTAEEKRIGLMFRKQKLPEKSGMLFVYNKPTIMSFWMKNTFIDLDILFLDGNKKVIGKCENLKKHTLKSRSIGKKAKYAIELNAGTLKKYNINKKDTIILKYEL